MASRSLEAEEASDTAERMLRINSCTTVRESRKELSRAFSVFLTASAMDSSSWTM